ncbi:MAG: glycosyltransferase family 2 protein [Planctomycetes bacterium]|nr:glycosyltransferase family 2 protein [Planctomycetota bacterium]
MTRTVPVTVVVPAYNAARWLPTALDSVQQQTALPTAVVVVDDGSDDDTAAIAMRAGALLLRQDRRGPGAARNRGIAAAATEFVAFLDADDWYTPDKLERSVGELERLKAAALATDAWVVRGDRIEARKNQRRTVPSVVTMERLLQGNPVICSTVVARLSAVRAVGGFDEHPDLVATEDFDLWLRLARREPLAYLPDPMTFYRVHTGSLSANERFLRGVDRILDRVAKEYEGEAHFQNLVRRRRADVRLDLAWDLLEAGKRQEAKDLIDEARRLASTWKGLRMRLRTLLAR